MCWAWASDHRRPPGPTPAETSTAGRPPWPRPPAWWPGRHDAGVLAGAGLDLPLHGMGNEKEAVGQEREFGEDAVELVVDQRPALAVAEIRLVLDFELGADVVRAHAVGVVDRVDDDGLERVLALGDLAAGGEQLVPGLDRHLEHVEGVQPRLGGQEQRALGARAPGRLADLAAPVSEHRQVGQLLFLRCGLVR